MADLAHGQKTGLFFDQRPNHAFGAYFAKGARVLNLFPYFGGSGLAALAGGGSSTLTVDASQAALEPAWQGATLMGLEKQFSIRNGDAFEVMAALVESGREIDVVICDPPAFAASKKTLHTERVYDRLVEWQWH